MYSVRLLASVHTERKKLPGNMRQRIKGLIDELAVQPRPSKSKELSLAEAVPGWEIRRLRVDRWRILYGIDEQLKLVAVLAIRKRPPYDYEDLSELLNRL